MACLQRTLVVGAGIGGLATAIALRRRGIAVDVVEIQPKIEVYGVGIIQHGNVVREMASLGLLEKYLDKAYAFEDVGQYAADGTLLHRVTGHRLAGDRYPANVGISRLELHKVLVAVAEALGARISLGVTVESFLQDDGGVDVVLSDGMRDCYDLVVGADGVQSRMRALLFGEHLTPRLTGQSVWRYNFPRAPEVDHLATFSGPRGNAGLCPLADDLMYMYLTSQEPGNPRFPTERLPELMRERLAPFGGLIARVRDQIVDPSGVIYRPLAVIFLPPPWFTGRVVLVGDAAHATTPHLGQGAGMAIEDAVVLAEELVRASTPAGALDRFMQRRFERCKVIFESSVTVGQWEMENRSNVDRFGLVRRLMEVTAAPI